MYIRLFSIIAPIIVCAAVGFVWARSGRPYDTKFVTRLLMNVGMPFLIVSSLSQSELDRAALTKVGLATVLLLVGLALVSVAALRLFRRDLRAFLPSLMFPNTGNMGLPICLFAYGQDGLSLALIVFIIVSMAHFTFGIALVSGNGDLKQFLKNPIIFATAVGVVFLLTGWELPLWIANTLELMSGLVIPLMLLTLGVSLARLKVQTFANSALYSSLRLIFGFGAGLAAAELLGLTGVARGVVILEASMPVAVFNYLMAERYNRSPDEVAGNVVVSTVMSFVTLPVVLWYVLSG
jgi:predicted permease